MLEFGTPRIILPPGPNITSEAVAVDITVSGKKKVFVIALGNLTDTNADAIVYRALPSFGPSAFGGVYSALKINAGVGIFYEAQAKADRLREIDGVNLGRGYKELPQGFTIATSAGGLAERYKNIIHVNLMLGDRLSEVDRIEAVRLSIANSLKEAERLNLGSVAIPAIGASSGVLLEECLLSTLTGVRSFYETKPKTKLDRTLLVIHAEPSLGNAQRYKGLLEQQLANLS